MDLVKLQQPRETTFRAPKMNSVEIPFFQHGQSEVGEIWFQFGQMDYKKILTHPMANP